MLKFSTKLPGKCKQWLWLSPVSRFTHFHSFSLMPDSGISRPFYFFCISSMSVIEEFCGHGCFQRFFSVHFIPVHGVLVSSFSCLLFTKVWKVLQNLTVYNKVCGQWSVCASVLLTLVCPVHSNNIVNWSLWLQLVMQSTGLNCGKDQRYWCTGFFKNKKKKIMLLVGSHYYCKRHASGSCCHNNDLVEEAYQRRACLSLCALTDHFLRCLQYRIYTYKRSGRHWCKICSRGYMDAGLKWSFLFVTLSHEIL